MVRVPYLGPMLEPRGADSSASFEPATDVSARELIEARNALLQGRIADALELVENARRDQDLSDESKVELALTGLLSRLARGDLRGAAPFSRELTSLVRVRGPVAARACFGLGEFASARGQADQGVSYYESAARSSPPPRTTPGCPGAAVWRASWQHAVRWPRPTAWSRTSSPRRGSRTRRTPSPTRCAPCPRSPRPTIA